MLPEEIERAAYNGNEQPDKLAPPEVMLFQALASLYGRYRLKLIDKPTAQKEKKKIYSAFKRMNEEYRQFIEINKFLQEKIRREYGASLPDT